MRWLRTLRVRSRGKSLNSEIDDELAFHLEMRERELIEQGLTAEQARREARLRFGNKTSLKEDSRGIWSIILLEEFWQDVRYGVRQLAKNPGFTLTAVLLLSVGIATTTTMFSVVKTVLFSPPPFQDPSRFVTLWEMSPDSPQPQAPKASSLVRWRENSRLLDDIALLSRFSFYRTAVIGGQGVILRPQQASSNLFGLLGVHPLLGRSFTPEDARNDSGVVIIGYDVWQNQLGGDPDVLGKRLDWRNEKSPSIVGVMPPGFWVYPWASENLVFEPIEVHSASRSRVPIARLSSGSEIGQVESELNTLLANMEPSSGRADSGQAFVEPLLHSMTNGSISIDPNYRQSLTVFFGAVLCVLLISCANVAVLLLARALSREREVSTRAALGAGKWRLVRQVFVESRYRGNPRCSQRYTSRGFRDSRRGGPQ